MQTSNHDVSAFCSICLDRATGRHYGANSCDGCKGFFRRTIRKRRAYVCRFNQLCVVDKDHRNTCRRCRFEKCLMSGMRKEAVQLERDRIASRGGGGGQMTNGDGVENPEIDALIEAEKATRQLRATVITRTEDARRPATTLDVTESMHQQLILMVEWAKHLEGFRRLPLETQIALLRHFSAQHLVFCAAYRSINIHDAIWLTNDTCLHRNSPKIPDVNRVAWRILDHLTHPMKRLNLDESEYVSLKAIAFFDPPKGVEDSAEAIEMSRQHLLAAFERHVTRASPLRDRPQRLANLLLLLPPMLAIARDLVEDVQLARLFGLADIDLLMQELMLPEEDGTSIASGYASGDMINTVRATFLAKSILKSQ